MAMTAAALLPLLDDDVLGYRVWFALVASVEAGRTMLALGKPWLRPVLFRAEAVASGEIQALEPPLLPEREKKAKRTYDLIVNAIRAPQGKTE
jgi:hypothetical protein